MRISILLIALTGFLAFSPANAGPGKGQGAERVSDCDVLKGGTPGLHGLCVSFCAKRDLSNVDLNDISSVRAAAPDISILRMYDSRRREGDPVMPCFKNAEPPDDGGGDDTGGGGDDTGGGGDDTGGGGTTPPVSCPCWTAEELAAIDGILPLTGYPPALICTSLVDENGVKYQDYASEGYDLGWMVTPQITAWASVDGGPEPYTGCLFNNLDTDAQRSLPLEYAVAENCMAEVANQCAAMGQ